MEVEVEPDDAESSYPGETTGNTRGHKGYQSTDVDEHGRLRPRPKKRPAVLLPAEECELPHDATLEILAGDLVLKSVNAVASAGSSSGGSAPHKSQRRAKPSHPAARSAASPRPERVKKTETNITSGGSGKRGPQTGPPMRDPRSLPPSIWFMEGDPDDDAPLPPPKAVAKATAKPRTARAQARMMSALLRISRANRARAAAVATKTGAADPPLPRELHQPAEPCCWSVLSNGSGLESTRLRFCLMASLQDYPGLQCTSDALLYMLPSVICRRPPLCRACLHQAADSCSGTWVESSLRALVFLSGGLRTHTIKPESLQAPTLPWPEPLPGLDPVRLATSGLTPPPMTAHTMPVCLTHWLQGWPDVYQAGDTEPCYVCLRLPRPNADVDEPIVAPDATSTTLQPVGALSLHQHSAAGPAIVDLGLHEALGAGPLGRATILVNTAIEWSVARIFRVLAWPTGCLILDAAGAGMNIGGGPRSGPKWVINKFIRPIKSRGTFAMLRPGTSHPLDMCHKLWIWKPWTSWFASMSMSTLIRLDHVGGPSRVPDLDSFSIRLRQPQFLPMSHSDPNSGDRLPITDDNLLTLPRFPTPRVIQSVGVRVESGSHLLSGPNLALVARDGKPWRELYTLLPAVRTVTWNSSPYDAAQLLSPANSLVAPTARPHLENVMSAVGWPQAGTTCGQKPRSHQKSHRGKLMLSLHSDWWVLGPTLPGEIRYLFLTKHGVPIRLILLMAPALQHLTRPYPRTLPLARLTPRATSFFCEPHCCSSHRNVQAVVPTRRHGSRAGPVPVHRPVALPRSGVLRPLSVLWALTHTAAGATNLRTPEGVVKASMPTAHVAPPSASTYSFARKRSYKGAVRRAAQGEGQHTQYRGRVCTLQQLCRSYRGQRPSLECSRRSQQHFLQRAQNRLLVLTQQHHPGHHQ